MNEYNMMLQKINLAIEINTEFSGELLPSDRVAFILGRIDAYKHVKEMMEEFIKENVTVCERIYK